ncbi:hypothetical protein KUG85_14435 [Nitratireductor sp. L1-7-SE]|uniref:Uncharacterized protein n=1 Tax=Nitratireductor rhodophyticola TaxID=2854036 RepID=A0ABS7R7A8_9HYPH|nr:hypothetical protein [Nitratireductor rhodophyticola]MBY8916539.1 hypothetical protein [Nitratireductor rhodophyticola]MBY8921903.1 hypothetical protein [Nitratireductor rhodophyticola]
MNAFARRDQILDEFRREAKGSFSVVYRALSQLATEKQSLKLEEKEVRERIKKIMSEEDARAAAG